MLDKSQSSSAAARRAMGKNSNVHKSQAYINQDILKEREEEQKKARRRARAEQRLAEQSGEMSVEEEVASERKKKKAFGKVKTSTIKRMKIGKHERPLHKKHRANGGLSLKPSLQLKKGGIRKPSALMRKTLKKIAKQQDSMVL